MKNFHQKKVRIRFEASSYFETWKLNVSNSLCIFILTLMFLLLANRCFGELLVNWLTVAATLTIYSMCVHCVYFYVCTCTCFNNGMFIKIGILIKTFLIDWTRCLCLNSLPNHLTRARMLLKNICQIQIKTCKTSCHILRLK